ncbi:hypothetical protein BO78DRAFT_394913 [Aspergillus sclerotiicarbonarius CBS 121057]|uniref:Uncharacterized protein n=1 Tax=Aspergillus sclerotiicarbonarius (strain CBS 121057 / IBT 28362) TaxID=1448318 RepID=A0A319EXG1_ASPSB|nr:hypothetical protein BO78DRAFT_394913 [Aspergillus sclerotiicarbonarius CBS 121057]
MKSRMTPDDLVWEQAEDIADNWVLQFLDTERLRPIAEFIRKDRMGSGDRFFFHTRGSYNIKMRLMSHDYDGIVIQFAQPGSVLFPEEKVANEVVVMRFIMDQTAIPVPLILHSGTKKESPLELSPFIMMEYIEYEKKMYDALNTPECPREKRGVLDPNIDQDTLELLYGQMAKIVLQLSLPSLPRIGSLTQIDDFTWEVTRRPLSSNMNELVRRGGLPRSAGLLPLPDTTYATASSYFETLAELHVAHFIYQRNDAIESADDCRRKFIARHLFRKLAREKRLTTPSHETGPFKLWCDDFRPANVLLNKHNNIAGVIDWEFTYAAPVEFSHAPPWWLLIERPELWTKGIEDWTNQFDHRLNTFLNALKNCEDTMIQQGRITEPQRLSGPMLRSWESGDFWIMYAALNSFAFDAIYWQKIDPRFFEHTEDPEEAWKDRLHLLDEEEKTQMEKLVTHKLEDMKTRVLSWDPDESTLAFQQELTRRREQESKEEAPVDEANAPE